MHRRPHNLLVIAMSMVVPWLASAAEAQSHRHQVKSGGASPRGGPQASAVSTRPAPRPAARREVRPNRGLIPPGGLGSAANVRPGFYQQLNAPRHRGHGGLSRVVPVYIYPTYYPETTYPLSTAYPEPVYSGPVYSEPEPPAAPASTQVYIVTPPVIAAPQAAPPPAPAAPPAPPAPRSTEPGEVKFSVLPADARVYFDDDYLGTGAELAALEQPPMFSPGVHVLEVTHPDYRSQRLVFGVSDSDPAHVLIDLSIDRVGRRTRVR
jgi:hypothetical protein